MASSMAKFAAFLCVALLVAHAESARLLKEVDDFTMVAGTYSAVDTEEPKMADIQNFGDVEEETTELPPAEDSGLYNYNRDPDTTVENPTTQDVFYSASEETPDQGVVVNDPSYVGDIYASKPYIYDASSEEQEGDEPVFHADQNEEAIPATSELTSLSDLPDSQGYVFGDQEGSFPYQKSEAVFTFDDTEDQSTSP